MEQNLHCREKAILSHPKTMSPTDLARFVLLPGFKRDYKKLELTQFDLNALQVAIMANPAGAPIVQGTGGLRKLRFAPKRWRVGKSGGARVCYVYFEKYSVIVLMAIYRKATKDNLSMGEVNDIKGAILRMESALERVQEEEGDKKRETVAMMAKKKTTKRAERMAKELNELADVIKSGEAIEKKYTMRTVELELQERDYEADDVRHIRESLNVSQAVFAKILLCLR